MRLTERMKAHGLKNAKNCERCTAYSGTARPFENACELGYNNSGAYIKILGINRIQPQEPCPKPLTIEARYKAPRKWQLQRDGIIT
jgi:hypothetical protein